MIDNNSKGYLLAIAAAICWGISGTFGQYLFQEKHLNLEWLVTVRLLIAGALLLSLAQSKRSITIWAIWKNKNDRVQLILFSLLGMLAVQYTYFAAINYSNAATATVLQYLGPVIIAVYVSVKKKKMPARFEIISIALAIVGTFLLVTHGNYSSLSISGWAVFWGISSAFAMAYYSIQPLTLLKKWNASVVIGWGMMIGGFAGSLKHSPWKFEGQWDMVTFLLVSFIILFATLGAFYAYLISIKLIGPTRTSLLACTEPLSAAFLAVTWLKVPFGIFDMIGSALIILTIFILALNKNPSEVISKNGRAD